MLFGCFQPQGLQCGLGLICNVATLSGDNKLETCSVSAAWAGQCSVGAWSGWQGLQIATSCSGQICSATKTCSWNPVQIGVAGQPLASDLSGLTSALGCFAFNLRLGVLDFGRFAMLQLCQVTALLGNKWDTCSDSAAWAGWQV